MATRGDIILAMAGTLDGIADPDQSAAGAYMAGRLISHIADAETAWPLHLTNATQAAGYQTDARKAIGTSVAEIFEDNSWRPLFLGAIADGILLEGAGVDPHPAVRVATTANTALSGLLTIDGVTLIDGDRVGVKDQTTGSQNGIYVAHAGAWVRATDMDAAGELVHNSLYAVLAGTVNAGTSWICGTADPITIGTTATTWSLYSASQVIQPGAGLSQTGDVFNIGAGTGIQVNADDIQISPSYAGQSSIVTVGVIGAGTWQGGVVAPAYGGTGLSSYAVGDLLYASGSSALSRLAGYTGTGRRLLRQTGTGSASAAPVWDVLVDADVPATLVRTSRVVASTSPLTGGGDLSADRTLGLAGLTGLGTAHQVVTMNAGGTGWEYKSVAGTAGRITVTAAPGVATWDIASTYTGQASITTVGTISSGVWNATAIGIVYGGTGLSSYTLGDTLYASGSATLAKLAGNTTTTKKFLRQTGTGSGSAAPAWDTLVANDVPTASLGGTTNQVNLSASGVGVLVGGTNITLSLPQNIHTGATPTFAGAAMTNDVTFPDSFGIKSSISAVSRRLIMRSGTTLLLGENGGWTGAEFDIASGEYDFDIGGTNYFALNNSLASFATPLSLIKTGVTTLSTWAGNSTGNAPMTPALYQHTNSPTTGQTSQRLDLNFNFQGIVSGVVASRLGVAIRAGKEADWTTSATINSYLAFYTTGANSQNLGLYQDRSGNVGVGLSGPAQRLEVNGAARITSGFVEWNGIGSGTTTSGGTTTARVGWFDSTHFRLQAQGVEMFTMLMGGTNPIEFGTRLTNDFSYTAAVYSANASTLPYFEGDDGGTVNVRFAPAGAANPYNFLNRALILGLDTTPTTGTILQVAGDTATMTFGAAVSEHGPYTIRVSGSGGSTPATKGTAYGRDLIVVAGASDNTGGVAGGDLYLRGGAATAPATVYGDVRVADLGGNLITSGKIIFGSYTTEPGPYNVSVAVSTSSTPTPAGPGRGRDLIITAGQSYSGATPGGNLYLRGGPQSSPTAGDIIMADQGGHVLIGNGINNYPTVRMYGTYNSGPRYPRIEFYTSQGTSASPTQVGADQVYFEMTAYAYSGLPGFTPAVGITGLIDSGPISDQASPGMLWFQTASVNGPLSIRMSIDSIGVVRMTKGWQLPNGGNSLFDYYGTGSFTATLNDVTTVVTRTVTWVRVGKVVILIIPAMTGTSNSSFLFISGIPSNLQGSIAAGSGVTLLDNGVPVAANAIANGSTLYFARNTNTNSWTGSGVKGFMTDTLVTYTI